MKNQAHANDKQWIKWQIAEQSPNPFRFIFDIH